MSRLAMAALALGLTGRVMAQEPMPKFFDLTQNVQPYTIQWSTADGSAQAQAVIREDGDFTFYESDGRTILVLKRDAKGDPIHELLATMLVRTATNEWDLKDWRDWRRPKPR